MPKLRIKLDCRFVGARSIVHVRNGEILKIILLIILDFLIFMFIKKDSLIVMANQGLPPVESGVLVGMVLGDKAGINRDLYQLMKNSGLVHLVVASGANVMLIFGGLVEIGAMIFGRKKTIVAGLGLIWWYAGMVNWEIPIVRAVVLVSIMYLAQLIGRKFEVWRGLGLTVAIMWLADLEMWTEVSFWMSLMAFIGVLTVNKLRITNYELLTKNSILKRAGKAMGETVWVGMWVTPVMAMVFGKISVVMVMMNMLVVGLVEVVTVVGGVGMVVSLVIPWLGKMILWIIYPILRYFVLVVEKGGSWQWSSVEFQINWLVMIGWYLILGWLIWRRVGA